MMPKRLIAAANDVTNFRHARHQAGMSMSGHMRPQPLAMPTARLTGSLCRSLISRDAIVWIAGLFDLRLVAASIVRSASDG
jgi:hypothetical protein